MTSYDVSGGDYPIDQPARFDAVSRDTSPVDCLSMFTESFYYWLRNGHCYSRIDALLAALEHPIDQERSSRFVIYEFERDGTISVRPMERDPFAEGMVSDQQSLSEFEGRSASGVLCSCYCRDQTKRLGALRGGKHGGQPVVGYPLDWSEQSAYSGNELQALMAGKGKLAAQLSVVQNCNATNSAVMLSTQERAQLDRFQRLDGSTLPSQPRRSIYSGGLATDIEISIVRKPFLLRRQKSRNSST